MKVNMIFLNPDDKGQAKSWCDICKHYRQYFGGELRCPLCGSTDKPEMRGDVLVNEYESEPMIASKADPKKQRDVDLPQGAQWVED